MPARAFVKKYWLTIAFVAGFFTDLILLNQIDSLIDNLVLLAYVVLATLSLLLFYAGTAERFGARVSRLVLRWTPTVMQYSFGGLLSGMLIFYGRSGDWLASAPFLLLIIAVVLGNEVVEKRSERLVYNLVLYFIGILSYCILVVPVLLGRVGDVVFFFSGMVAVVLLLVVLWLLGMIVPRFMQMNMRWIIISLSLIYFTVNGLYYFRIIPPIPLSLTELDIAERISRDEAGNYRVVDEVQPWYRRLPLPYVREEIFPPDSSLACFARVYAPLRLNTDIYHDWDYKVPGGEWTDYFELSYSISGLNRGGYRGYTVAPDVQPGLWRCSVTNERGQVLGRRVVTVPPEPTARPSVTRIE